MQNTFLEKNLSITITDKTIGPITNGMTVALFKYKSVYMYYFHPS